VIRVVLDSNVWISALVFGGTPRQIVELGETRSIELCVSPAIRVEVERILEEKSGWQADRVRAHCRPRWGAATSIDPKRSMRACEDPDDDRILECAIKARAACVVTGDSHLLRMRSFENIPILSPAGVMELSNTLGQCVATAVQP